MRDVERFIYDIDVPDTLSRLAEEMSQNLLDQGVEKENTMRFANTLSFLARALSDGDTRVEKVDPKKNRFWDFFRSGFLDVATHPYLIYSKGEVVGVRSYTDEADERFDRNVLDFWVVRMPENKRRSTVATLEKVGELRHNNAKSDVVHMIAHTGVYANVKTNMLDKLDIPAQILPAMHHQLRKLAGKQEGQTAI